MNDEQTVRATISRLEDELRDAKLRLQEIAAAAAPEAASQSARRRDRRDYGPGPKIVLNLGPIPEDRLEVAARVLARACVDRAMIELGLLPPPPPPKPHKRPLRER